VSIIRSGPSLAGTWSNGQTVTFTGSGFGTKSPAGPVLFDNGQYSTITTVWDGAWPSIIGGGFDTAYSAGQRGVAMPTPFTAKYITGCSANYLGADNGYNIMVWKSRTIGALPQYTYASWYSAADPAWQFSLPPTPHDGNFKEYDWSIGGNPYGSANLYTSLQFTTASGTIIRQWNDDDSAMQNPDSNGNNFFGSQAPNPINWLKQEVENRWDMTTAGYLKWYINCVLNSAGGGYTYKGPTAGGSYTGTTRTDGIGGFIRDGGANTQWRYLGSLYLDYTLQRVMLGNASTLANCTIREPQPATAWSDTSITVTVNQGNIVSGAAWVFVLDAAGATLSTISVTVP
jgi:hypothetical protein